MEFDFTGLAVVLGSISVGLIGLSFIGNMLWPEWANKSKQSLQTMMVGFILLTVGTTIIDYIAG